MSQMSMALMVMVVGGLWCAERYVAKLRKGKSATLVGGQIYGVLLVIGLVLALLWA
jgi:hypothetical protein